MPGAFAGKTVTRRRFMSATATTAGAVATDSNYVPVTITLDPDVGQAGLSIAYVRKHNPEVDGPVKDRYDHVIAISSRCVHVGCPVRYVQAAQSFVCPCHAGVYNFRGMH